MPAPGQLVELGQAVGRGTGQGLAIARQIVVERHGGSIDFETRAGRGTTFHVRLPVAEPVVVDDLERPEADRRLQNAGLDAPRR